MRTLTDKPVDMAAAKPRMPLPVQHSLLHAVPVGAAEAKQHRKEAFKCGITKSCSWFIPIKAIRCPE